MTEPWYVQSFGHDYLKIYAHRTDEAADDEIRSIISLMNMQSPATVLDLCCGNGRHSRSLNEHGFLVTGLDLSDVLLREAEAQNKHGAIRYTRSDVRSIPYERAFDYVLNLFTSFGYFDDPDENAKVFRSIYQALRPQGQFLVDFLNPDYVRRHLQPYTERTVEQLRIIEERHIADGRVIKHITVQDGESKRSYKEVVQLFSLQQMKQMVQRAGLSITNVYGDLQGRAYNGAQSDRMIICGGLQ